MTRAPAARRLRTPPGFYTARPFFLADLLQLLGDLRDIHGLTPSSEGQMSISLKGLKDWSRVGVRCD